MSADASDILYFLKPAMALNSHFQNQPMRVLSSFPNQPTRVSPFFLYQPWEYILLFMSADASDFSFSDQPMTVISFFLLKSANESVISLLLSAEESLRCWQAYPRLSRDELRFWVERSYYRVLKAGSETPPQRNHLPNNRMFHVDSQLINHSAW